MSNLAWADRVLVTCLHCGHLRRHIARGLCNNCHQGFNGCVRADYPRLTWPSAELVADYRFLAELGLTRLQAAERLGITKKRLEKAIERQARKQRQEEDAAA